MSFSSATRIGLFGVGGCYPSNRRVGGGYGTAGQGDGPRAGTGGRRAHNGRPKPGALADQNGPRP